MNHFEYRVSIIVPVYNVELYLKDCLNSLVTQTIDLNQMEILLIDDGSTDSSLEICKDYALCYHNIKVFSQQNSGPSVARNWGIQNARGKYIMYLDSDDTLTSETVKNVTDFFDKHYEEVDMVTYPEDRFIDGRKMSSHFRYQYMNKSGIYDLNKNAFIMQTRINIAVKNRFENNILFDVDMIQYEDQKYLFDVLRNKMKIGFCEKGLYQYLRNENGIMGTLTHAYYFFEPVLNYFEELFASYQTQVPQYVQNLFVHDLSWKLLSNCLFPYHYEEKQFRIAMNRIHKLLNRVDTDIILNCPSTDKFHRYYLISLKNNPIVLWNQQDKLTLLDGTNVIFHSQKIEIVVNFLYIRNHKLTFLGFAKSPIFNFIPKPKILACVETNEEELKNIPLDVFDSFASYYKCKTKTNQFWSFYFEYNLEQIKNFQFKIEIDGILYDTSFYFMRTAPFRVEHQKTKYFYKDYIIEFVNNCFLVKKFPANEIKEMRAEITDQLIKNAEVYLLRKQADQYSGSPIWLYYDCRGVEKDNGYYQFLNDYKKEDGVTRYYILANDYAKSESLFEEIDQKFIVPFGSDKHKMLFLNCDKILTAFIEAKNFIPFELSDLKYFVDILHYEVIYLQHGILHAHLPWKYAPGSVECHKVVVSSKFELENFKNTYHFREQDLIPSGMPRFDHMRKQVKATNRILLAPSWRNYLIGSAVGNSWNLMTNKFLKSNYFFKIQAFLNNKHLDQLLHKYHLYLDFKLHPIFKAYQDCFQISSDRITFAENTIQNEEYAVFITDFSSFVFDFVYLKRPIIYFVPDYMEFKSGMNQYRELDLPFEEAFGKLVLEAEEAVQELEKIIQNGCIPETIYLNRMENFYLPLENCAEKLYKAIK